VPEPLFVSVKDGARRVGIGRDAMYGLVKSGRIPSLAVGRKRLIPVAALERFAEDVMSESAGESP
jgi:excisionase family DNA binding protein